MFWKNEWNDTGTADLPATDPACGSDSCSLTTTLPIEGKYTWNVTASNSGSKTTVSDNMEFRVNPNITTPGGILPSGYINNRRWVSFVFDDVRDGVKEYNVQIYNEDKRVVMDEKRKTSELTFANNRVTFNAYVDLPAGKYYWRVRGRSDNSLSNWSAPIEIRTTTYYQPPAPPPANNYNTLAIFSPSGTVTDASLTLSWRPIVGASSYTIKVYNSSGAEIFSSDVSSSVCSAYSCSATPGFTYPAVGSYRIYVAARSATGVNWGDGSSWVTYSTTPATVATTSPLTIRPAGSDPNQATVSETRFLSPADQGKLHVSEAAISWVDQGETVKYYDVKITDATGATLLETTLDRQTAYCNNKNCTIVFDEIAPADGYRLTLTPKSENGTAGTATTLTFNVTDQDLPMTGLYPTEGQTTAQRPYFSWTLPTGTANAETFTYALKLKSTTNKAETIYSDLVCTDERVGCFKGGASFVLTENLPAGEYTWQVQNKETNLMTEEMKFVVP